MPPRGWRKHPVDVPPNCPNASCRHLDSSHKQWECIECDCSGWMRLPPKNEWKLQAGWYNWGQKGPLSRSASV